MRTKLCYDWCMQVRPNRTILTGKVVSITAEPDGRGVNIGLKVSENKTTEPEDDFIRSKSGEKVSLYSTESGKLKVGDSVQVSASLSGGPFGQRIVIEEAEKILPE